MQKIIRAHSIRLNSTPSQETFFKKACGCARVSYNWILDNYQYQLDQGKKPDLFELKREFNKMKRDLYPWISESPKDANLQPFTHFQNAINRFFKKQSGFPVYKKRGKKDSFYISNDKFKIDNLKAYIPKLGWVKITERLRFSGKILKAVVRRKSNYWFVVVSVETLDLPNKIENQDIVGVDLGIKALATLSNGDQFLSSKPLRSKLEKLKQLHRIVSRRSKGGSNRKRAIVRLSKLYYVISCIRKDILNKLTTHLCKNFKYIAIEDLNVAGMLKNHKLALSVSDLGFGEFRRQLEYKSKMFGNELIIADRFYPSSKLCSRCGWKKDDLTLSDRVFSCKECGLEIDRDLNASLNLKNYGLNKLNKLREVIPEVTLGERKALAYNGVSETIFDEPRISGSNVSDHICLSRK